jgi:hypothetical protein
MHARIPLLAYISRLDGEFTVEALTAGTGIKPTTVRTILGRHQHLFQKISRETTGRPGGRSIVYRLRSEARTELEEELKFFQAVDKGAGAPPDEPRLSAAYRAALEQLIFEPSNPKTLQVALEYVAAGKRDTDQDQTAVQACLWVTRFLLELGEWERKPQAHQAIPATRLREAQRNLRACGQTALEQPIEKVFERATAQARRPPKRVPLHELNQRSARVESLTNRPLSYASGLMPTDRSLYSEYV